MASLSSIAEVLERTAGRTIFVCMHADDARSRYDNVCEVCWDCRSVRGHTQFDMYWRSVTRIQLQTGQMLARNGASVAHDWRINPAQTPPLAP